MIEPPILSDEVQRLRALRALHILDTPPEERFDRITRLAAQLFDVPISVITMVDADRQWFKSRHGLDASETARSVSFCGHTISQSGLFHVTDASSDERFADNPLVAGDPKIRFYAGMPLYASGGEPVGTLCLIDTKAREFSEADRALLNELARWAQYALSVTERANSPTGKLRPWLGTVLTAMLVGLFAFLSSQHVGVPDPPAILAVAVVFAAYHGGLAAGLASALIACLYLGYYFSIPGNPFRYAGDKLGLVLSWALATPAIAVITGVLRRRSKRQFEADMGDAVSTDLLNNVAVTTAELRKSHEQLSLVTENAPIMISFFDAQARCRYANQSYARWLGLDLRQMLGRKLSDILANQGISESDFESVHARVLAGEKIERKREHRHPDGRISKVAVSLVPQFSVLGQVTGINAFAGQARAMHGHDKPSH